MAPDLILFTSAYPFGNEEYFLEAEIPFLAAHFRHILIVPANVKGISRSIPKNVSVDLSYSSRYPQNKFLNYLKRGLTALASPLFYQYREGTIRYRLAFFSNVETARLWLMGKLQENPNWKDSLFYTYWFYAEATALAWVKKNHYPCLNWISRVHGFDLLEEAYPWQVIPARRLTLAEVKTLYCISEHGQSYLKKKYGYRASLAKLGVRPSLPSAFSPSIFRIVSCSNMTSLKRIHLIIESIAQFAKERAKASIEWHHFGDGPLKKNLEKLASSSFPENSSWKFHGQVQNQAILSFYEQKECSLFILLSETEGIPVAIMEALAASIPVIATNVGGISEVVDTQCGRLLSSHPSPQEVAEVLTELYDDPPLLKKLKKGALYNWSCHHNAEVNYPRFCKEILS